MTNIAVDPTIVPALFEHAANVYAAMARRAKKSVRIETGGQELTVYEGHLTNLFKELRLSVPYYTKIKNMLVGMGCIEQIRRGGGNGMSMWVLWKKPTLEEWKAADAVQPRRGNIQTVHSQQIKDLNQRLTRAEQLLDILMAERTQL